MTPEEEFVSRFYNLFGKTQIEKIKYFNTHLLNNIPSNHDVLISALQSRNLFEKTLKLRILLKLENINYLIDILTSGDEYLSFKLLKCRNFCQKFAEHLEMEDKGNFVKIILPSTSYVVRNRLLVKLSIYGKNLDGIFDQVLEMYGIHVASYLFTACTLKKMQKILTEQEIHLRAHQWKLMYEKSEDLFKWYEKEKRRDIDESVIQFIALKNIKYCDELKQSHHFPNFGKRLTKKFVLGFKNKIVKDPKTYKFLHSKTLYKSLKLEELSELFKNCCPENPGNLYFSQPILFKIQRQSPKLYYKLLCEAMIKKFNKSIYDYPNLISDEIMEALEPDERQVWVKIKQKDDPENDNVIPYMKLSESIPLIKKKIIVTSTVHRRERLLELLLKTCKINKDMKKLAEVCEYVLKRHRNDAESVLRNFLDTIQYNFKLEDLEEQHWEHINSVLKILDRHGDNSYFKRRFYTKYIEFLNGQGKLTEEEMINFFKYAIATDHLEFEVEKDLKRVLLLKLIDMLPLLVPADKLAKYDLNVFEVLSTWNKNNSSIIPILDNARLKKSLIGCVHNPKKDEFGKISKILEGIIYARQKSNFEFIKAYLQNSKLHNFKIDLWLIKHEIELVEENLESFLKPYLEIWEKSLFQLIKYGTDIRFQEKVLNIYLKTEKFNRAKGFVLAMLQSPDDFLQLVRPFYPSENRMEVEGQGEMDQTVIAESFKYSRDFRVLPDVVLFCKGDFLRYALESLYYLFYHSPEKELSVFVKQLSLKAVSVRKHSIFLSCALGSIEDVRSLVQNFIENEKNVSVQKHLFTSLLKYFKKNPCERFWELLKLSMANLDQNDVESLNLLLHVIQIPTKFQPQHVVHVWNLLKGKENSDKTKCRLLSSCPTDVFIKLPLDFLQEVINLYFLKNQGFSIDGGVISELLNGPFKNEILTSVFNVIEEEKKKSTTQQSQKLFKSSLNDFIDGVVNSDISLQNLEIVFQKWQILFTPVDMILQYLNFNLKFIYLKSDKDLMKFSLQIGDLFENLVSQYGCDFELSVEFYKFCLSLLNYSGYQYALLVIKLLPNKELTNPKINALLLEVVDKLHAIKNDTIQMLMNIYLTE